MEERLNVKKTKRPNAWFEYFIIIIAVWIVFSFITSLIEPTLIELCKVRARGLGITIANQVVQETMTDIGYLDLIILDRDENGKILALRANVIEMNRISAEILSGIQELNNKLEEMYIKIPIGNFTGNSLLAGRGPFITVKIIPTGTVNIEFKTEFVSTGINQTRHRVYLEIKSTMGIVAPFTSEKVSVVNEVNIAETVLIGEVPTTFYNLEGVTDVTSDDSLNMWEN